MSNIEQFTIYSENLQRDINIYARIPSDKNARDVIYMHDGHNAFSEESSSFGTSWKIQEVLENLENQKKIPQSYIIGFECNHQNQGLERLKEYSLWDNETLLIKRNYPKQIIDKYPDKKLLGRGNAHIKFVVEELIPLVEQKYNLDITCDNRSILGSSMGGMMSLTIGLLHQDLFSKIYGVSNAFWYATDGISKLISETKKQNSNLKIYLDVGDNEGSLGLAGISSEYITTNLKVKELLEQKNYNLVFNLIEGGQHTEEDWHKRLETILLMNKLQGEENV